MSLVCGDDVVAFVSQSLSVMPGEHAVGIGYERDGNIVCAVSYDKFCGNSVEANIWISELPPLTWVACILDYPYNRLGVEKMVAWVRESNHRSLAFCKKLGFVEEGRITDYYKDGSSALIMTLSVGDCKLVHNERLMRRVPK